MTQSEPERLALELHSLIQRRDRMRAALESALKAKLTPQEVAELQETLAQTRQEQARLEERLRDLLRRGAFGAGGTG